MQCAQVHLNILSYICILSLSIGNIHSVTTDYTTTVCNVFSQSGLFIFMTAFIDHIHSRQFICALGGVKRNLQKATCTVGPAESYKH